MIRVVDKNDTGKTRKLLEECSKDPLGLFVCRNPESAKAKCMVYRIPLVNCVSYTDFINNSDDFLVNNLYIDELEKLVKIKFTNLKGYSLTI